MNNSRTKLVTLIFIAIGLIGTSSWAIISNLQNNDTSAQITAPAPIQNPTEITYQATPGMTSLDQLRQEADGVIVKDTEYGKLVEAIAGNTNGTDGKYWSFYVNDEMAQVGAGSYAQKKGDVITWKFQKL